MTFSNEYINLETEHAKFMLNKGFTVDDIVVFWRMFGESNLYPFPEVEKLRPWDQDLE